MGRLLIAGDSFGELSGYRNHITSANYAEPQKGYNYDKQFKHWCELLAEDLGYTAESHAIGGAGVSSSAFVAMQQLLTNKYSVCVFFVSHHERTMSNRAQSHREWLQEIKPNIQFEDGTPEQLYDAERHQLYKTYKHHYHREGLDLLEIREPQVAHLNIRDIEDSDAEATEADLNYLTHKPAYSYTHDAVTSVLGLKALCDAKGIPVVFASCFSGSIMDAINNMGINIQHFKFFELEAKHNFDVRHDFPSHYNEAEHNIIYTEFKNSYPEFIKLYKQND